MNKLNTLKRQPQKHPNDLMKLLEKKEKEKSSEQLNEQVRKIDNFHKIEHARRIDRVIRIV